MSTPMDPGREPAPEDAGGSGANQPAGYGQPSPYAAPEPGAVPPESGYGQQYPPPQFPPPQYGAPQYGAPQYGAPGFDGVGGYAPGAPTGFVAIAGHGTAKLATTGQRVLARLVDGVILLVVVGVLLAVGVGSLVGSTDDTGNVNPLGAATFISTLLLILVIALAYEVVLVALRGATLGKQVMGISIVRSADGGLPGWGPSFVRWIIPAAASFVCGLLQLVVYASFLFDSAGRMQGWHDKAASTLVVSSR